MKGWQELAGCKGQPHLFDLTDRESNFRQDVKKVGLRDKLIKAHNLANFKEAARICAACPVFSECREDMGEEDLMGTFRAGKFPHGLSIRTAGRPRIASTALDKRVCKRGHVGKYKRNGNGHIFCGECKRISDRASYTPVARKAPDYIPGTCPNGHVDMYVMNNRGHRQCLECERQRSQKKRDEAKNDIMSS